ncbi:MAG: prolyl-tRNA synthetase associated domain-containing protein [Planctomycetaceae bacterium]|nr:prolyl-tRNA synthetase associated domain-containing protein [Planctomycetaceae bacterium]
MRGQAIVYETLDRLRIPYECIEHEAAYTAEDMAALPFPDDVRIAKNLFLRDSKGKRHFLVVMALDRPADLRRLGDLLGAGRLSFASADRLNRYLRVERGAVSPFSILNDEKAEVEVVVDASLAEAKRLGVHPNDNTITVCLRYDDILRIIEDHGNPIRILDNL